MLHHLYLVYLDVEIAPLLCVIQGRGLLVLKGRKCHYFVSSVDIKHFRNRTKFVGRVIVTVSVEIVSKPVMTIFYSACNFITKIMIIPSAAVNNLSKYPHTCHIESCQLLLPITAILKHQYSALSHTYTS